MFGITGCAVNGGEKEDANGTSTTATNPTFIPSRDTTNATPTRKSRPSSTTGTRNTSTTSTLRSPSSAWNEPTETKLSFQSQPQNMNNTSHRYQQPSTSQQPQSQQQQQQPFFIRSTPTPASSALISQHDPYATLDAMDDDELVTPRIETMAPTRTPAKMIAKRTTTTTSTSSSAATIIATPATSTSISTSASKSKPSSAPRTTSNARLIPKKATTSTTSNSNTTSTPAQTNASTSTTSTSASPSTSTSTSATSSALSSTAVPAPKRRPRPSIPLSSTPSIPLDRSSLRDWITSYHQMSHRIVLIEREVLQILNKMRENQLPGSCELEIILECEKLRREGDKERGKEAKSLFAEITHIRTLVDRFKHHVINIQDGDEYLAVLRTAMEQVEDQLSGLKGKQRDKFHKLSTLEKDLSTELTSLLSRFESFDTTTTSHIIPPDLTKPNTITTTTSSDDNHIHPEIASIDHEIQTSGGVTGGWNQQDHDHFIKLSIQCHNEKILIQRCITEIPNQTTSTISQHIIWYTRYQELVKQKKQIIHEWKEMKLKHAEEVAEKEVEARLEKEEQEKKQKDEIATREREEKARQVAEWKQQKKQQQEADMARQKADAEAKAARKRQREEEGKARLKSIVESYQQSKETEQRIKQDKAHVSVDPVTLHEREEAKRRVHEKAVASIRAAADKRQAKLEEAAAIDARKAALIAASTPALSDTRDPSRLVKLTAAQEKRKEEMKAENEAKQQKGTTKALVHERVMLGHRAVPSWRQGL